MANVKGLTMVLMVTIGVAVLCCSIVNAAPLDEYVNKYDPAYKWTDTGASSCCLFASSTVYDRMPNRYSSKRTWL
jgi:hypothetical protein